MSRKKNTPAAELPDEERMQQELQQRSEHLAALHEQLEESRLEKLELIQSRNYAIIIAVVCALAAFYLLFLKGPEDNARWQYDQVAKKMAGQKAAMKDQLCPPATPAGSIPEQEVALAKIEAQQDSMTTWQDRKEISRMIYLWAVAWELKEVDRYLSYYSEQFDPQSSAESLDEWKAFRSYAINRPSTIKVIIEDINIEQLDQQKASVSFNQYYETPDYNDMTHKLMELVKEDGRWLIVREHAFTTKVNFRNDH